MHEVDCNNIDARTAKDMAPFLAKRIQAGWSIARPIIALCSQGALHLTGAAKLIDDNMKPSVLWAAILTISVVDWASQLRAVPSDSPMMIYEDAVTLE